MGVLLCLGEKWHAGLENRPMTTTELAPLNIGAIIQSIAEDSPDGMLGVGELFAGYGGLGEAVRAAFGQDRTAIRWFSEFEPGPSAILAHHYPDVPNLGDITKIRWHEAPRVNIVSGGFPCQDVSLAGARRGMNKDTRTGLWAQMMAGIVELQPEFVVFENVRGLLSAKALREEPYNPLTAEVDAALQDLRTEAAEIDDDDQRMAQIENLIDSHLEQRARLLGIGGTDVVLRALGAVLGDLADAGYDTQWQGLRAADVGAPHGRYRVFGLAHRRDIVSPL